MPRLNEKDCHQYYHMKQHSEYLHPPGAPQTREPGLVITSRTAAPHRLEFRSASPGEDPHVGDQLAVRHRAAAVRIDPADADAELTLGDL